MLSEKEETVLLSSFSQMIIYFTCFGIKLYRGNVYID